MRVTCVRRRRIRDLALELFTVKVQRLYWGRERVVPKMDEKKTKIVATKTQLRQIKNPNGVSATADREKKKINDKKIQLIN